MRCVDNIQYKHVGNKGDILKHSALRILAEWMQKRQDGRRINYLDTHTFSLLAPVSNDFLKDKKGFEFNAGYREYFEMQIPYTDMGLYLCSCGIAIRTLENPRLFLSESNPATRLILEEQLQIAGVTPGNCDLQLLLPDIKLFGSIKEIENRVSPLLALIDPFSMKPDIWKNAQKAISAVWDGIQDAFVLCFHWTKDEKNQYFPWPFDFGCSWLEQGQTNSCLKEKYQMDESSFRLAVYTNLNNTLDLDALFKGFGWTVLGA